MITTQQPSPNGEGNSTRDFFQANVDQAAKPSTSSGKVQGALFNVYREETTRSQHKPLDGQLSLFEDQADASTFLRYLYDER